MLIHKTIRRKVNTSWVADTAADDGKVSRPKLEDNN
jgi:hypothetical protein